MKKYQNIKEDCFWDLKISSNDIYAIVSGGDFRKKEFLFEKILWNSTRLFESLSIFERNDLKIMLEKHRVSKFNDEYIFKRKNMAEVYFFDKLLLVDELKWTA